MKSNLEKIYESLLDGLSNIEGLPDHLRNNNNDMNFYIETMAKYIVDVCTYAYPEFQLNEYLVRQFPLEGFNAGIMKKPEGYLILLDSTLIHYAGLLVSLLVRMEGIYDKLYKGPESFLLSKDLGLDYFAFVCANMISKTPLFRRDPGHKYSLDKVSEFSINPTHEIFFIYNTLHFEMIYFLIAHEFAHAVNGDLDKVSEVNRIKEILENRPDLKKKLDTGELLMELNESSEDELRADEKAMFILFNGSRRVNEFSPVMRDNPQRQFILLHSIIASVVMGYFNQIADSANSLREIGKIKPDINQFTSASHPPGNLRTNNILYYIKKNGLASEEIVSLINETYINFFENNYEALVMKTVSFL